MSAADRPIRVLSLFGGVTLLGAERANLEALAALREQGAEVTLMVSDAPWAEPIRQHISERGFQIQACPYLLLPRPERRIIPWLHYPPIILLASLALLRAAVSLRPTHIQAGTQLYVLNFLPALLLLRAPMVYRCGDRPVVHNRTFRFIWRFIVRRAARFVAVSRFIADDLVRTGVDPERVEVIYSRPPVRKPGRAAAPSVVAKDAFNIVFVGQINEAKGCRVLIEAFRPLLSEFPDARLVMAGRISDWEGDAWSRAIRDETLADPVLRDRIRFVGFVEDVPSLLSNCDLNVVPTLTEEPLANVVMEAKQAGIPSVVFRSGGLPEVVQHGVDGMICEERSVAALQAALRSYLGDPDLAKAHGRAAKRSLPRFGLAEFANRWRQVYARAFERRS